MNSKITKRGDSETLNNLIARHAVEDDAFGEHIFEELGQLTVDVYQTDTHLVMLAPVAGVEAEDLDISVSDNEVITIKGTRAVGKEVKEEDYLTKECYWGAFSRSIVLPDGLDLDSISASFKRGVLKVEIPKVQRDKVRHIKVKS